MNSSTSEMLLCFIYVKQVTTDKSIGVVCLNRGSAHQDIRKHLS